MRRKDKAIPDRADIDAIIRESDVCRLGLAMDNVPYVLPLSFGYDGEALYFHTAKEGRKIKFFEAGNPVCFSFESGVRTVEAEVACNWTSAYRSVIGYGRIEELKEREEAFHALNQIMLHYSGKEWEFKEEMVASVRIWKLTIESISGKASPPLKR